jgi:hypothetical protein
LNLSVLWHAVNACKRYPEFRGVGRWRGSRRRRRSPRRPYFCRTSPAIRAKRMAPRGGVLAVQERKHLCFQTLAFMKAFVHVRMQQIRVFVQCQHVWVLSIFEPLISRLRSTIRLGVSGYFTEKLSNFNTLNDIVIFRWLRLTEI